MCMEMLSRLLARRGRAEQRERHREVVAVHRNEHQQQTGTGADQRHRSRARNGPGSRRVQHAASYSRRDALQARREDQEREGPGAPELHDHRDQKLSAQISRTAGIPGVQGRQRVHLPGPARMTFPVMTGRAGSAYGWAEEQVRPHPGPEARSGCGTAGPMRTARPRRATRGFCR